MLYAKITNNDDDYFKMSLYQSTNKHYNSYVYRCINKGFSVDSDETKNEYYSAYNKGGYKLEVKYYGDDSKIIIILNTPIPMSEIAWPNLGIVKSLPVIKSNYGYFESNSSDTMDAYGGLL